MPTYEYECKTCGKVMDLFQSITAAPLRKAQCEACGKERAVRRLIGTGGGLIFKGSGFYQTDYRSEGYKNAAKADSGPTKDGEGQTSTGDKSKADQKAAPATSPEKTPAASPTEAPTHSKSKRSSGQKKRS